MKNSVEKKLVFGIVAIMVVILIIAGTRTNSLDEAVRKAEEGQAKAKEVEPGHDGGAGSIIADAILAGTRDDDPTATANPVDVTTEPTTEPTTATSSAGKVEGSPEQPAADETVYVAGGSDGGGDGDGAPGPVGATPATGGQLRPYTVKDGDSFARIAKEQLGDARRARELVLLNEDFDPRLLHEGDTIWLPPAEGAAPVALATAMQKTRGGSGAWTDYRPAGMTAGTGKAIERSLSAIATRDHGAITTGAATPTSVRSYVVEKGDTLISISRAFYHNANWKKIWEANRDRLASPDRLTPGTMIVIP